MGGFQYIYCSSIIVVSFWRIVDGIIVFVDDNYVVVLCLALMVVNDILAGGVQIGEVLLEGF